MTGPPSMLGVHIHQASPPTILKLCYEKADSIRELRRPRMHPRILASLRNRRSPLIYSLSNPIHREFQASCNRDALLLYLEATALAPWHGHGSTFGGLALMGR